MESLQRKLIVIRGPSSVGKTTAGKALAKRIGYDFIDEDEVRHTFLGEDLTDASFDYSIQKLNELTQKGKFVVAGAFLEPWRLDKLNPTQVFRLTASLEKLYERNDYWPPDKRMKKNRIKYLHEIIEDYPDEIVIDTENKVADEVVDEIYKSQT